MSAQTLRCPHKQVRDGQKIEGWTEISTIWGGAVWGLWHNEQGKKST
jgi:hypothetical protein